MGVIWVYAVAERPERPLPQVQGLAQAPLEGVPADGLLAAVTRHDRRPAEELEPDELWTHDRVVEQVMAERAVLPVRFGTTYAGDDALRAALAGRRDELLAALDRVRGRVELSVRAVASAAPPAPAETGHEWLRQRLDGERVATAVHESLAALAGEARRRPTASAELLRAAYLVDRGTVERFGATVERLQQERPELAVVCTGPWPPYSFAEASR